MRQNTQIPFVEDDDAPFGEFDGTPDDILLYRFALFAAFLGWSAPAGAQSMTGFPLAGVHATQTCARCHTTMPYKTAPTTCGAATRPTTRSPSTPTRRRGLPDDLRHVPQVRRRGLEARDFNHSTETTFPLAGAHTTRPARPATRTTSTRARPATATRCHKADYQSSANPGHVAAGFPTTCDTCHKFSDAAWKPASFNHSTATTFPLAGLHTTQACTACHKNNVYKGTPRDCYSCHITDYQKSVNPPHLGGGFPTTCDQCHLFSAPAWALGSSGLDHEFPYTE